MLENNNLKICLRLIRQDFKFHKIKNLLSALAIFSVTALYCFVFLLGNSVKHTYLLNYEYSYGTTSHILYEGLNDYQADILSLHPKIKSTVSLQTLGYLSDEMIGLRSVKLAVKNQDYAKTVLSLPSTGRLPETDTEIALDELTMNSLGIPHELNTPLTIQWTDFNGTIHHSDFILCGWWNSPTILAQSRAWINQECADRLFSGHSSSPSSHLTLGVMLYQPDNLEIEAEQILNDLDLSGVSYTINLAYQETWKEKAFQESLPFYEPAIFVVVCGFLMIYSIIHVAAEQNIPFFASLKTLGMTPRQIQVFLIIQSIWLCLMSLLPGWIIGFGIHFVITPHLISKMEQNPALYFLTWHPFLLSGALTFATALSAYFIQALWINKMTPVQAMQYVGIFSLKRNLSKKLSRTTLLRLASHSLFRNKHHMILSLFSLFLAILLLSVSWIRYSSYDESIYLAIFSPWDYSIVDGSSYHSLQRYNQKNMSIPDEMPKHLRKRPEVRSVSTLKTHELSLNSSQQLMDIIKTFYNEMDQNGETRRSSMANQPNWYAGLERFEQNGEYIGIVVGIDGDYLDYVVDTYPLIDGKFDAKAFENGDYVLTSGSQSFELATLPAGSPIQLNGREFQIMACVMGNDSLLSGSNSPDADFHLTYYIPLQVFNEMFPGQGIRQLAVNIDPTQRIHFEDYIEEYKRASHQGLSLISQGDYQNKFNNARINLELTSFFTGIILLIIGLMNFTSMLISQTMSRKKEFAAYESLGMMQQQLKRLLALEGLVRASTFSAVLVLAVFPLTWFSMPFILSSMDVWCINYHYTLTPLWFSLLLITSISIFVPLACLRFLFKETLAARLRILR